MSNYDNDNSFGKLTSASCIDTLERVSDVASGDQGRNTGDGSYGVSGLL